MIATFIEGTRFDLKSVEYDHAEVFLTEIEKSRSFLDARLPWVRATQTIEDALRFIDSYSLQREMENGGLWGLFHKKDGAFMGCICLQWVEWEHLSTSIGYWLLNRFTGNGYATEALKLISHYAFNSLKLNRLEVDVAINNPKSIALLERVGFQEEGLFREYTRLNGVFLNHRRFSLLSTDMAATRL